jgi:hypothetical protein
MLQEFDVLFVLIDCHERNAQDLGSTFCVRVAARKGRAKANGMHFNPLLLHHADCQHAVQSAGKESSAAAGASV